ncbi:MAG: hypothetical protein CM15mP109_09210 [Candidatus Dadabacteria bacterium]|nr:MAG: hypothetical protein CM15mP109_09210 [Candidatus Dadabacteria bacterium]
MGDDWTYPNDIEQRLKEYNSKILLIYLSFISLSIKTAMSNAGSFPLLPKHD